ncbi:MAG TPA: protein TolR [Thermomonas sp.]|jgi:biopolymer transport protein TolR|uniref:protein TolR n=1 Tax=Thermomonas sp. TaxID=1971895 RepID=UPI002CC9F024|nr:protein TolR [Thermomonas sp.]HOV95384.1 protein TolR [Thermomonas sp.]
MAVSNRRARKRKLKAEINVVPYIDVMLVLLIIFMVTAPLLNVGVDVNLPQANAKSLEQKKKQPLVVQVFSDGKLGLMYEGLNRPQAMDEAALLIKVAAFVHADPDVSVYVAGDGNVRYQVVYALMGKLQSDAKVSRVSLMGAPPTTTQSAKPGK